MHQEPHFILLFRSQFAPTGLLRLHPCGHIIFDYCCNSSGDYKKLPSIVVAAGAAIKVYNALVDNPNITVGAQDPRFMSFFLFAGCQQLFPVFSDAILLLCISQSSSPSLSLFHSLSVSSFSLLLAGCVQICFVLWSCQLFKTISKL